MVVWLATVGDAAVSAAHPLLLDEELARARRLKVDRARHEFVLGRALLRALTARGLGIGPRDVAFSTGQQGKLAVEGLHVNVSHSHGVVAVAMARGAEVGIDVEWLDRRIEALDVARGNFAAEEVAQIEQAPEGELRTQAFCRIWTRKEAVLKAHGRGLGLGLASFAVAAAPERQRVILDGRTFHVQAISAPARYAAAVAVEGPSLPVRVQTLRDGDLLELFRLP